MRQITISTPTAQRPGQALRNLYIVDGVDSDIAQRYDGIGHLAPTIADQLGLDDMVEVNGCKIYHADKPGQALTGTSTNGISSNSYLVIDADAAAAVPLTEFAELDGQALHLWVEGQGVGLVVGGQEQRSIFRQRLVIDGDTSGPIAALASIWDSQCGWGLNKLQLPPGVNQVLGWPPSGPTSDVQLAAWDMSIIDVAFCIVRYGLMETERAYQGADGQTGQMLDILRNTVH